MSNSVFGKIAQVQVSESAPYFEPGTYHLKALRMITGVSQQGKGPFFVAEFEIIESNVPTRPAGSKVAQVMYFSKGDVVLANIKALASALLGVDHAQITAPVMEQLVAGDGTAIAGRTCWAEAAMIKTRAQSDFTKVSWQSEHSWSTMGRTMPDTVAPSPKPPQPPVAATYPGFHPLPQPAQPPYPPQQFQQPAYPQQAIQQPQFQQPQFQQPQFQQPAYPQQVVPASPTTVPGAPQYGLAGLPPVVGPGVPK